MKQISSQPGVNLIIHVTSHTEPSGIPSTRSLGPISEKVSIKGEVTSTTPSTAVSANDPEKGALDSSIAVDGSAVNMARLGRPDIEGLISAAATPTDDPQERVIVGACGPRELIAATKTAVNNNLHSEALSLTLYSEVSVREISNDHMCNLY